MKHEKNQKGYVYHIEEEVLDEYLRKNHCICAFNGYIWEIVYEWDMTKKIKDIQDALRRG